MALSTRQRRPQPHDPSTSSPSLTAEYSKTDKPKRSGSEVEENKTLGWFTPLLALGLLRYMSATSNIIHDCDEVFNYWEPLHYLLYGSGFQTWEYRFRSPTSFIRILASLFVWDSSFNMFLRTKLLLHALSSTENDFVHSVDLS